MVSKLATFYVDFCFPHDSQAMYMVSTKSPLVLKWVSFATSIHDDKMTKWFNQDGGKQKIQWKSTSWKGKQVRVTIEDILTIAIVLQYVIRILRSYCDGVGTIAIVFREFSGTSVVT